MAVHIDPPRSPLTPVAQVLAEAALQRQSALLGPQPAGFQAPGTEPTGGSTVPVPVPAPATAVPDQASISAQARERLAAGFDPRGSAARAAPGTAQGRVPAPVAGLLRSVGPDSGAPMGGGTAQAVSGPAWPASGPGTALLQLAGAAVTQLTAGTSPQRVLAAQPWPLALAQSMESGEADAQQPPLQTWLVRQGVVQAPDGARGVSMTLRVPVPWLAAQPLPATAAGAPGSALSLPFAGAAQSLQSGVLALVLQGPEGPVSRTSALLVMDLQAPPAAALVYGRDPGLLRADPWVQMAVLQASGQVPREDERARNGASGLCDTVGCPYAARAACVQPFCVALRDTLPPPEPIGPVPLA